MSCLPAQEQVSTHSRPKAAGSGSARRDALKKFQHTAARRRLGHITSLEAYEKLFQHTAARRRLGKLVTRFNC